jgi:exodeoxyribonuclease VII large subunit
MTQSGFDFTPAASPARDIYTVSRLNRESKLLLEGSFPSIWIEGEISKPAFPPSGHVYFNLKDASAVVRCAMFRGSVKLSDAEPCDGMHVLVRARVSLYEGRGEFQLIVEYLEEAGEGALRRAFEQLKQRLAQEGLFDTSHKRPLPRLPRRIGLITSASGAVLHDIVTTLKRRFPAIAVLLYPVPVQGAGAAEKIAAAIRLAGTRGDCDALIVARGGGSLEDLWAFNEEAVARAIHTCPLPIVSAVGHETDVTIADFVADARAPTPTAAAEMLSPDWREWDAAFRQYRARLAQLLRAQLQQASQRLDWLGARLVHPRNRIEWLHQRLHGLILRLRLAQGTRHAAIRSRLTALSTRLLHRSPAARVQAQRLQHRHVRQRLDAAARRSLDTARERLGRLAQTLHALSPLATLERGYAIVRHAGSGAVLRDARTVQPGEPVRAQLAHGAIDCRVEKIHER